MILNNEDHIIFKNYIQTILNKNTPITLLIDAKKCYDININNNEINIPINNISLLLEYLKQNNIFISNWKIKSNLNLFNNNNIFQIFDLLYKYFIFFNKLGTITFPNYYNILNKDIDIKLKYYINLFQNKLIIPCYFTLKDDIQNYYNKIYIIINPEDVKDGIEYYNKIKKQKLNNIYYIINKYQYWDDIQITDCLTLINEMITDKYNQFINKADFANYVIPMNNIKYEDPIVLSYLDRFKNNNLNCELQNSLSIDCNDLSFPTCCGMQHSIFNGGHFIIQNNTIIDIEANEGINGFLNQKITNNFFQPNCISCENKYFCNKGCHGYQWEYNAEPYIPVDHICRLQHNIINLLIARFDELQLFDIIFQQNELTEQQKESLLTLLTDKGYINYEYKYC